jgi:hypothetical protein
MTSPASGSGLRIDPAAIPGLTRAFQQAADQLRQAVAHAGAGAPARPAMGDDASLAVHRRLGRAAGDQVAELTAFGRRLDGVLARLRDIQRAYDHHDQATADALTRRLAP